MNFEGLWPHQVRGLTELQNLIDAGETRICITAPTGAGKSRMMMTHILANRKSTLYTDRKMLFSQLAGNLDDANIFYGRRASGHRVALLADTQLAMLQTEKIAVMQHGSRDIHNSKFQHIDEAHNNSNGKTLELLELHGGVRIGWTATPLEIGHAYDHLVVAGTNEEMRECGSHVPAKHFAPSEVSSKVTGKIKIGSECGIAVDKRADYVQRIYGSVIENYRRLNPDGRPTILFGPDVAGSLFLCKEFIRCGISAAHIDGENCYLDGKLVTTTQEVRDEIAARSKSGDIKVCTNRHVLREGIDWPWLGHCIFATTFGSVTSYIQAGGRMLRNHPSIDSVTIQDHGGNYWRHGSLNSTRSWDLNMTNSTYAAIRNERIREGDEPAPLTCPNCDGVRIDFKKCPWCGWEVTTAKANRKVIQTNGQLVAMDIREWRQRRKLETTESLQSKWSGAVYGARKYKPHRTFAQLYANFARNHNWKYPPRDWPNMPKRLVDWYLPVSALRMDDLHQKGD